MRKPEQANLTIPGSLLMALADDVDPDRWLLMGGDPALAEALAVGAPAATVDWGVTDVRHLPPEDRRADESWERIVRHPDPVAVQEATEPVGAAVLPIPPDRDLARRWLMVARRRLPQGGSLLLAGANAEGAKTIMADATALFGSPSDSGYQQKHRFARYTPDEAMPELPAWATAAGVDPGTWESFSATLGGQQVTLETVPGVFAGARLDEGTALLLDHLPDVEGQHVLDVGSGAGLIAVAAAMGGASQVDATDANLFAVAATRRNLARLAPDRTEAFAGDVYSGLPGRRYDLIVSNPPFHRGKADDRTVADRLAREAPKHLAPGGQLLVVANAFRAYRRPLEQAFANVDTVTATPQFHVLRASKPR